MRLLNKRNVFNEKRNKTRKYSQLIAVHNHNGQNSQDVKRTRRKVRYDNEIQKLNTKLTRKHENGSKYS